MATSVIHKFVEAFDDYVAVEDTEPPPEAPVEATVETPMEAPAETPVEAPVEATAEVPAEATVETPVETPVEATAEAPAEATVETPVEATAEAPAETPVEAPVEALVETPVEARAEAPAETPVEALVETPVEAPAETPVEAPVEATAEAPAEAPVPPALPAVANAEENEMLARLEELATADVASRLQRLEEANSQLLECTSRIERAEKAILNLFLNRHTNFELSMQKRMSALESRLHSVDEAQRFTDSRVSFCRKDTDTDKLGTMTKEDIDTVMRTFATDRGSK